MARKRIINIDFDRLERQSYESLSSLGREIIDKMIEMNGEQKQELSEYQKAKLDLVYAAMGELTERQRQVLCMAFGVGDYKDDGPMTERQIAEKLKLARTTVETLKTRAIKHLRDKLSPNDDDVTKNIEKS